LTLNKSIQAQQELFTYASTLHLDGTKLGTTSHEFPFSFHNGLQFTSKHEFLPYNEATIPRVQGRTLIMPLVSHVGFSFPQVSHLLFPRKRACHVISFISSRNSCHVNIARAWPTIPVPKLLRVMLIGPWNDSVHQRRCLIMGLVVFGHILNVPT
jgi:hypothetical protein